MIRMPLGLGVRFAWEKAQRLGFEGLQTLPVVGWNRWNLRRLPDDAVVAIESDAWNQGTVFQALRRHWMDFRGIPVTPRDEPPTLADLFLFGTRKHRARARTFAQQEGFPRAVLIRHKMAEEGGVLELCPEALADLAARERIPFSTARKRLLDVGHPLCLDYRHLVRWNRYNQDERVTASPVLFLAELSREQIQAVHINPDSREQLEDWLAGNPSRFSAFFDAVASKLAGQGRQIPVVAEIYPLWADLLPATCQRMRRVFSG